MISQETISLAGDSKFTEFSDAIKQELKNKLMNHEISKKYSNDFDYIQNMKNIFKQVSPKSED